jgi:hypothetical protein
MRASRIALTMALFVLTLAPLETYAACGEGKIPTYSDIAAVGYEHAGSYQVLFLLMGPSGRDVTCKYVEEASGPKHGTYSGGCPRSVFNQVVKSLAETKFYSINLDTRPPIVTDSLPVFIAVRRCGVTTQLDWINSGDNGAAIASIATRLNEIIETIQWKKSSKSTERSWIPVSL